MTDQARGAGHTKGPWAVNPFAAQVDAFDAADGSPLPICQLLWPTDKRSERETYSNARLIAAAPDLLFALQNLLDTFSLGPLGAATKYGPDVDLQAVEEHAVETARLAIAKAKGETE